jgi:hypothetical protein
MMLSPIRAEKNRCPIDVAASSTASPAMSSATVMTMRPASGTLPLIALMTLPARTGVATAIAEEITTSTRNRPIMRRYGRAKRITRAAVARPTLLPASSSLRRIERIMPQLLGAMPPMWLIRLTSLPLSDPRTHV